MIQIMYSRLCFFAMISTTLADLVRSNHVLCLTQAGYGTIFSLVTHGFHGEEMIRLKAKYQCSTLLNGTTAEALALVGMIFKIPYPACVSLALPYGIEHSRQTGRMILFCMFYALFSFVFL